VGRRSEVGGWGGVPEVGGMDVGLDRARMHTVQDCIYRMGLERRQAPGGKVFPLPLLRGGFC
jgi:hypothetical protein